MAPNSALLTDAYSSPLRAQFGSKTRTLGELSALQAARLQVATLGGQIARTSARGEQDDRCIGEVEGQRGGKAAERRSDLPALTERGFLPRARSVCDGRLLSSSPS
jgi:hypothetical protein